MTKKAAVINDLSSFGRCSLTAAIAVLSVMGHSPCPLPTAVLSAQSEFPVFCGEDLSEMIPRFQGAWLANHERFDGIATGYFAHSAQLGDALAFIRAFRSSTCTVLVDPVMGDNGKLYPAYDRDACGKMKRLAQAADVLTPNLTELCLLTDVPFAEIAACPEAEKLSRIERAARAAAAERAVIVTGIPLNGDIGNLTVSGGRARLTRSERIGESFSGTGDIFSSVVLGCLLRGDTVFEATETAADFVSMAIADTIKEPHDPLYGVNFEKFLNYLR